MKNNNSPVIRKLVRRSLKNNKKRNFFITTAIALTTLLIASVFSIGMSLFETMKMHETRLMGTTAHASVTQPTASQIERLKQLDYVKTVGTGNFVASVQNTPQMGDMTLSMHYFDKTEWEKLRAPAYTDIAGYYPQKENEIMVPLWVLERLGIENPSVGMEIRLSCYTENFYDGMPFDETFVLSGWFNSYMHIRSGNIDSILVSEALSDKYGKTVGNDGYASVLFDDSKRVTEYCEKLVTDLELSDEQKVKPVPAFDVDASTVKTTLIATAAIVIFLILTGYLLIYNVLYISVSRDVRFYGMLKTIGTTPKQIKNIVVGQILRLCIKGIPAGAAAAFLISFVAVLMVLNKSSDGLETGAVVSFSPLIYLGASLFALLTALLGAEKPAKKAAAISPIEALKYTGIKVSNKKIHFSAKGKPYKMAFRNIFRDKKRSAVVFLSLFLGITTFITVTTLINSMDTDNYISSYLESDFILTNNTVNTVQNTKQKFTPSFIGQIKSLPGLERLRVTALEWMFLDYSPEDYEKYTDELINNYGMEEQNKDDIKNNFGGYIVGIDRDALTELNAASDNPIDIDAFERGDIALIASDKPELFENIDELTITPVRFAGDSESSLRWKKFDTVKVAVGGFVPLSFERIGFVLAPTIFVSNNFMKTIYGEPVIYRLYIDVEEGYEKQALEYIRDLTDKDYEISRRSRLESQDELRDVKMILFILGGGVAFILAFIGILNFINVMSVGITVRKKELANLECIGMSRRQVRIMLMSEGLIYAVITLLLVYTAGNAVTYGFFSMFKKEATYAVFTYPIIPVLAASLAVLAVCVITPECIYRSIYKSTLVERLREAE